MTAITRKHSTFLAVLISALVFAAFHVSNPGITLTELINVFLMGILLGMIVLKTGNIYVAAGVHWSWNFCLTNLYSQNMVKSNIETSILDITWVNNAKFLSSDYVELIVVILLIIIIGSIKFKNVKYVEQSKPTTQDTQKTTTVESTETSN